MSTKLRRCIYIGLGGTGMSALLHTKKMFSETYAGKVPPMIGFIGIDSDQQAYNKSLDSKYGKVILSPYEQMSIATRDAMAVYNRQKEKFAWMPEENEQAVVSMKGVGAGQVRTNGRLAFIINHIKVRTALQNTLDRIQDAKNVTNPDFSLIGNDVEVHMVFSISGGTGAGVFLDMAYLVKEMIPHAKITAYAVMADVFESMMPNSPAMADVRSNAYGAIKDLDWLMHLTPSSQPIKVDYLNDLITVNERPFNSVMLIDNKNQNDDTYTHVEQLTEMISLALVIAAGELSEANTSVGDNLEKHYASGTMDIQKKKAWAGGMGACEILFEGNHIAKIYSIKAGQRVIQRLLNGCSDVDTIINSWIDSSEVNIRENNNQNNVIDYLLERTPKTYMVNINDALSPKPEIDTYISMALSQTDDVRKKVDSLTDNTKNELKKLVIKLINEECGVGNAEQAILEIQKQVSVFRQEMKDELALHENQRPGIKQTIEILSAELKEIEAKTFVLNKKKKKSELIDNIINAVNQYVIIEREVIRRQYAITFYTNIDSILLDEITYVKNIKNTLVNVNSDLTIQLADAQNNVGKVYQSFMIDLASNVARQITVDDDSISISDFIKKLDVPNKIYDLSAKDKNDVKAELFKYTDNLLQTKKWVNTSIDDIINELPEKEFEHILRIAINKANPLFRNDYQGFTPKSNLHHGYYVGVPDKKKSRLLDNNTFSNMHTNNEKPEFVQIGMKNKIIIYRQIGVVPAYAVVALKSYEVKYEQSSINNHFDRNILLRMEREQYDLMPRQTEDDTLELWVLGLIFGLIKKEDDNKYYYRSLAYGDPILDYWVSLDSTYRDEAFENFKRNKNQIRNEFNDFIENEEKSKGSDEMNKLKDDVKKNYYEKYSMTDIPREKLTVRENASIAELIRKELDFVTKKLF